MKITDVRCHLMQAGPPPHTGWSAMGTSALAGCRNWLFVTVHTDAGLVGTGEGSGWPRVVAAAVDDLRHLLLGEDPSQIDRIAQKLRVATMGHGQLGVVGVQIDEAFISAHASQRNAGAAKGGWNAGTEEQYLYLQARQPRASITRSTTGPTP